MSRTCCVEGCDTQPKDKVIFFKFPIRQSLQKQWREAIKCSELTPEAMVCSRHFEREDYETVRGKVRLRAKVVPSLFGDCVAKKKLKSTRRSKAKSTKGKKRKKTDTCDNNSVQSKESPNSPVTAKNNNVNKESPPQEVTNQETGNTDLPNQEIGNNTDKIDQENDINSICAETKDVTNQDVGDETDKTARSKEVSNVIGLDQAGEELVEDLADFGAIWDVPIENTLDENGGCTIECIPEAILAHDSDSNSETEVHKGDIEDIIANYHIKQNKQLLHRLKATQESTNQETIKKGTTNREATIKETTNQEVTNQEATTKETTNQENGDTMKGNDKSNLVQGSADLPIDVDAEDDEDVEFMGSDQKEPVFIEVSVDPDPNRPDNTEANDCLIVLENVQVDIDPATLLMEPDEEREQKKEDPISLLTSSDDDDVIVEEPHIDTVDVSDETDEDDVPLVKLANPQHKEITGILWGKLNEYYCYACHFKTTVAVDYKKHACSNNVLQVCGICNYSARCKMQYRRHMKTHKGRKEDKLKCHLCDYKARHRISMKYHLESHKRGEAYITLEGRAKSGYYRCQSCRFTSRVKINMVKHRRTCTNSIRPYSCDKCTFNTNNKFFLRKHVQRNHKENEERAGSD